MPIIHNKGGSTTILGESISFYRLCVMRSAVELESKGIHVRRGRRVWKQAAAEFQIKGNRAAVLAWLNAKVAELREQQEHVTEDGQRLVAGEDVQ
jgi:hypothetical protein